MTPTDSRQPEYAVLAALADYVEADIAPIQRALFAAQLRELLNVYCVTDKPGNAVTENASEGYARIGDIEAWLYSHHNEMWRDSAIGEGKWVTIGALREWFEKKYPLRPADLELVGKNGRESVRWHHQFSSAVLQLTRPHGIFERSAKRRGEYRLIAPLHQ